MMPTFFPIPSIIAYFGFYPVRLEGVHFRWGSASTSVHIGILRHILWFVIVDEIEVVNRSVCKRLDEDQKQNIRYIAVT